MKRMASLPVSVLLLVCPAVSTAGDAALVTYIEAADATGMSQAAVVGKCALAHTTQLSPVDRSGRIVGEGDAGRQVDAVLSNLEAALAAAGSTLKNIVKINAYVAGPEVVAEIEARFARKFRTIAKPAASFVVTPLPLPGALVAMDAVAALPGAGPSSVKLRRVETLGGDAGAAHVAVLPAGEVVYVSGQVKKGDLAKATADTLQGLVETLEFLGLDRTHVVQLKAFMTPMADAAVVRKELARTFEGQPVPPVSLVEWIAGIPIEIELIAFAPSKPSQDRPDDTVTYITPPGVKASPVYSRAAHVHGGKRVYIAGLYGTKPGEATAQIHDIFATLKRLTSAAGSDLRHLAKATYYVSDDDASRKLNEIRPQYYDPKRPPAASKAMIKGTGMADRSITLDMIAVTPR